MKKLLIAALCILISVFLLSACGSQEDPYVPTGNALGEEAVPPSATEQQDQSLTLTYYREESLNPLSCSDFTNRTIMPLLYQGLFAVNRDYEVEPILCKNYRISPDMKTYTFYVEAATFSDGSQLTAQDVAATLQAAKESDVYGGRFLHITEIALTEDGGVQLVLDTPYENLPILLDIPIIPAKDIGSTRPAGTGPYYLDESGDVARLRKRSDWWCTSDLVVTASSITLLEAESNIQIRDNFQFGGLNLVCADPGSDKFADFRCDFELWNCENGIFLYLACSADSEVFSKEGMRAALTHAIDRDHLTEEYYRSFAQSATLPASPNFPYYNQNLAAKYGYDSEKFTAAVNAAGAAGSEVILLVNSGDSLRVRVARAIGEMLTQCGLKVKMSELSGSDYTYAIQTRQFDLYLGQTVLSPNMDLSAFFHTYGALSFGGINDVTAYTLCLESLANYGNYYSLYKYVMENGLLCPVLVRSYGVYATRGVVTDLTPARDNVFCYSVGKNMEHALLRESE
ncbi:MAG: ABC transporter substrate-binding protein [Oscillospiraceae bacterium]|nr:ABC transporter substrate-binding protein [Oscillospiraceae bacterium]